MSPKLVHFLIAFDHQENRVVEITDFQDPAKASEKYVEWEHRFEDDSNVEVVLIGSDSIETIRRTHPNYFEGMEAWDKFLANL